ncbi:hypothetical protein COOONC_25073 [Cooperia oncophora]
MWDGSNNLANLGYTRKLVTHRANFVDAATLVDYLTKYHCLDPSHICCLVLDEADVMINQAGYTEQSTQIYK